MKTDLRIRTYLADLANHSSAYTLCHSGSTWMYHIIHNLSSIQIPEASLGYGQNRVIGESLTENFLIFQKSFIHLVYHWLTGIIISVYSQEIKFLTKIDIFFYLPKKQTKQKAYTVHICRVTCLFRALAASSRTAASQCPTFLSTRWEIKGLLYSPNLATYSLITRYAFDLYTQRPH